MKIVKRILSVKKEMSTKIESIVRLASKTFLKRFKEGQTGGSSTSAESPSVKFTHLFAELVTQVKQLTGDDVGLSKMLQYKSQIFKHHRPTALYAEVFGKNSVFLIAIFILYPRATMPLHSHPGMYGILKVIDGEIIVRSYNPFSKVDFSKPSIPRFEAYETSTVMDQNSPPAIVTPENNLHEIVNVKNDAAVFIDILSPPYTGDNCYFSATKNIKNELYDVFQIPCPTSYHTMTIPFGVQFDKRDLLS